MNATSSSSAKSPSPEKVRSFGVEGELPLFFLLFEVVVEEEEDEDQVPLKVLKDNARPTTPKTAKPASQRSHTELSNPWSAARDNSMDPPPETARQQHFIAMPVPSTNGASEAKAMNGDASIKPFLQPSDVCHFSMSMLAALLTFVA